MPTIYCIGKNYAAHVAEMADPVVPRGEPVVFLKPWSARLDAHGPDDAPCTITLPASAGDVHHEAELVVEVDGRGGVARVGLGLDLTDRTRQAVAKAAGLPWATAKGFAGSAPLGPLLDASTVGPLDGLSFALRVNGEVRQRGETSRMLFPIPRLLAHLDAWFGLVAGDLVFTGTPEGVGPLAAGDALELTLEHHSEATARFRLA